MPLPPLTKESQGKIASMSWNRALNLLVNISHVIEKNWDEPSERYQKLKELADLLSALEMRGDEHSKNLNKIRTQLNEGISLNEFLMLMIPLEREVSREVLEQDFLLTTKDRKAAALLEPRPLTLVLENIRSSFNVGAIFRTADCLGAQKVYLSGYTSTPENHRTLKAALGAHKSMPWEWGKSTVKIINQLKEQNILTVGLETTQEGKSIYDFSFPQPCALVLGNERFGLSLEAMQAVDVLLQVPTFGVKNSLNVGICLGICGYELVRQWDLWKQ